MNEAFEKHRDKRISEMRESIPDNKFNTKINSNNQKNCINCSHAY